MGAREGLTQQILSARSKIERNFVEQCTHGAQSIGLPSKQAAACGQFIGGEDAKSLAQRGMHGTAAALRVLAKSGESGANELPNKIFYYINNRSELEKKANPTKHPPDAIDQKCSRDSENVIKLAELLDALSFTKPTLEGREALIKQLVAKLKKGTRDGKGWGFFLDDPDEPIAVLPTAYAVLAMGRLGLGGEILGQVRYLVDQLKQEPELNASNTRTSDITERVMALYAVTFGGVGTSDFSTSESRRVFRKLWVRLERLLSDDFEQNVEYWISGRTYYVRVPWSLYLLALAARLDAIKFGSIAAQSRLKSILDDANGQGFRYHYSGKMMSSRTSAILYDVLDNIANDMRSWLINPVQVFDVARSFASSMKVRLPIALAAGGFGAYSVYQWWNLKGQAADFAPDLVSSAVTFLFLLMVKSR